MDFEDKVVIVTGASSGIGAETAIAFAKQGAKVCLVGRNQTKVDKTAAACNIKEKLFIVIGDVTKTTDCKKIIDNTIKQFGKIDVLVNNAGIGSFAKILDDNFMDVFDKVHNTNLRSIAQLIKLAAPYLILTKGNIVNISSIASMSTVGSSSYCASKAGLDHLTRCAAKELAPKGVRVNCVNPGPVYSDILDNMGVSGDAKSKYEAAIKKGTALDRISEPQETADVILFLASDKAKGITGSCYVTDNGFLLKVNS